MEINAKVYAAADDLKLLEQVHKALTGKTFQRCFLPDGYSGAAELPAHSEPENSKEPRFRAGAGQRSASMQ